MSMSSPRRRKAVLLMPGISGDWPQNGSGLVAATQEQNRPSADHEKRGDPAEDHAVGTGVSQGPVGCAGLRLTSGLVLGGGVLGA